jgi:hypothetical protein
MLRRRKAEILRHRSILETFKNDDLISDGPATIVIGALKIGNPRLLNPDQANDSANANTNIRAWHIHG